MVSKRTQNPNRDAALKRAYAFARVGNATWAQLWYDRACDFATPTKRQIDYLIMLARKAGIKVN